MYRGGYRKFSVHLLNNILFCLYLGEKQGDIRSFLFCTFIGTFLKGGIIYGLKKLSDSAN